MYTLKKKSSEVSAAPASSPIQWDNEIAQFSSVKEGGYIAIFYVLYAATTYRN